MTFDISYQACANFENIIIFAHSHAQKTWFPDVKCHDIMEALITIQIRLTVLQCSWK